MQEGRAGKRAGCCCCPGKNGRCHPRGGREDGGRLGNPGLCMLAQPPAGPRGLGVQGRLLGVCPEKMEPPDGRKQGRKKAERITHLYGMICTLPILRSFSVNKLFLKTPRFPHGDPRCALALPVFSRAIPAIPVFLPVSL